MQETVIQAEPTSRWTEIVMEEGGVVSKLASIGARIARGGALFVEKAKLDAVTEWLKARGMTWHRIPGYAIEEAVQLGEMDPISLVNSILYDPEHHYSWEKKDTNEWVPDAAEIEFAKEKQQVLTPDLIDEADNTTAGGGDLKYGWQDNDMTDHPVGEDSDEGPPPEDDADSLPPPATGNEREAEAREARYYDQLRRKLKKVTEGSSDSSEGADKKPSNPFPPKKDSSASSSASDDGSTSSGSMSTSASSETSSEEDEPSERSDEGNSISDAPPSEEDGPSSESIPSGGSSVSGSSSDSDSSEESDSDSSESSEESDSSEESSSHSSSSSSSGSSSFDEPPNSSEHSSQFDGLTGYTEKSQSGTYSTDPEYNPCALYMRGFCRVDGRVCLYHSGTYKDCPKRQTGLKLDQAALAIPPGEENNKNLGKPEFGA